MLAVGADMGCLAVSYFVPFSETARYRPKYSLKTFGVLD